MHGRQALPIFAYQGGGRERLLLQRSKLDGQDVDASAFDLDQGMVDGFDFRRKFWARQ